jgi:transposase
VSRFAGTSVLGCCPGERRFSAVMSRPRKYPEELLERGVPLALESGGPIADVAADFGITSETLRKRVRQAEADQGLRPDLPTSEEREEIKRLRQENCELRRANEILKSASVFFAKELDPDRVGCQKSRSACKSLFLDADARTRRAPIPKRSLTRPDETFCSGSEPPQ